MFTTPLREKEKRERLTYHGVGAGGGGVEEDQAKTFRQGRQSVTREVLSVLSAIPHHVNELVSDLQWHQTAWNTTCAHK